MYELYISLLQDSRSTGLCPPSFSNILFTFLNYENKPVLFQDKNYEQEVRMHFPKVELDHEHKSWDN